MSGWIKLYRELKYHWLFSDSERLRAWILILLTVNFESKTELIDGELITCNRGQSILSIKSWVKLFGNNWSIQKVRTFFKLLEKDSMIELEGLRKSTRLTVCNYERYQDEQHTDNTQITHRQHTDNTQITHRQHTDNTQITTTKEGKERKEIKNNTYSFKKSFLDLGVEEIILNDWLKVRKTKKASNTKTAFNKIKNKIEESGLSANEAIKISAENSWSGFDKEWISNGNKQQKTEYPGKPIRCKADIRYKPNW